ncbi:lycopene cyclase family protein [Actinokineospora spheciospongiae]|uniref:lycopene cyclase family protein n=1 Tax=Actinokineospora spheciospongiae TaxID=909613 RepID=UPI000D70D485|nr:lycopene cyclase family protein [Actinokineospora spheciospongiae]PWW56939.1 lycopene cyclase (CrtL-type) [Actinokineospora spheciospongiae]
MDVVVVGSGPAGWAVADACGRRGLEVALVAPAPLTLWPATYGMWAEQAAVLPDGAATTAATGVRAAGRLLDQGYVVLDNAATQAAYARGSVTPIADRVASADHGPRGSTVVLASGRRLACRVAVDASGALRVLSGGRPGGHRAEQTAHGLVFPAEAVADLVPPGQAIFMDDWSTQDGLATFLYAVPLPGGRTLVEETSLVAKPGVPVERLRQRLIARLRAAGVDPGAATAAENVRFPMDLPRPRTAAIGAAAGMVHPATGYSVADSLAVAPRLADAIAAGGTGRDVVWTPAARAVHALRAHGARVLRSLPAAALPEFFDAFFALPTEVRLPYLTGREDVAGTTRAMTELFRGVPWRLRAAMAVGGFSAALRGAA